MKNAKFLQVAFLSALLLVCSHLQGSAQSSGPLPALSGRVVDNASMLSAAAAAKLESDLLAHEKKSGHQFVVATIASLRGEVLEDFSIRLARKWGLGSKERDNGVLLLVAKNDRKIRIEVGYGLEGTLTDALSSIIIRETITPAFRSGDFEVGILRGAAQIMEVLSTGEMAPALWQQERRKDRGSDWVPILFVAIWLLLFFSTFITGWLVRRFGRQIKPGHYRWLGMDSGPNAPKRKRSSSGGWGSSGGGGGWSGGGGGFSGGGGGFGGGGSSGGW